MCKFIISAALLCISTLAHAQGSCTLPCLISAPAPAGGVVAGVSSAPLPGGRLTLVSGQPIMSADVTSATLWYAPYNSDSYPALDATLAWQTVRFSPSPIDQVGASMAGGAKWTAGSSRDIFGTATGAICSGPAWPAADRASRLLVRYNGIDVNSATLTCDTSASASVSCPQYQCTYLGSINSSVAGQLTAQFTFGQNRKFEVWTAYNWNQVDITLHVGYVIPTTVPTNQYPNWQPFNNDALNRANVFTGLPTAVDVAYHQNFFVNSSVGGPTGVIALVGWDGVDLGFHAIATSDTSTMASTIGGVARYINSSAVGLHAATMMVAKANAANSTVFGGVTIGPPNNYTSMEGNSVLYAKYKG